MRARRWWRLSAIWLVPALAAALVLGMAIRGGLRQGAEITVLFPDAEGLSAGNPIKFRNLEVGRIQSLALAGDRAGVRVTARLEASATDLLGEDARFWVVKPRVSSAGVSGIEALLAGAHIGLQAASTPGPRREFRGLDRPPAVDPGRPGQRYFLRAESIGSLEVDSPVFIRRFQVGQVIRTGLDAGGATLEIFVDQPHDRQVTADTRFWHASGVDLTLGPQGIQVDTQSLASVLRGGIALQNLAPPGTPPEAGGRTFDLFMNHQAALRQPSGGAQPFRLVFHRPAAGLEVGAPVELMGLELGNVLAVDMTFDAATAEPRTVVDVGLHLGRLRTGTGATTPDQSRQLLVRLVRRGLRAQLRSSNLLTGQRRVVFDIAPVPPGEVQLARRPVELPTFDGDAEDLPQAVGRLVTKLEALPLEQLVQEGALTAREMRRTLQGTASLVGQLEGSLSSNGPLQQDLRRTLRDLGGASYAMRSLAEYLERHPEAVLRGKKAVRP